MVSSSILLLVIVRLLLCLIYKLNFIVHVYLVENRVSIEGSTIFSFSHLLGSSHHLSHVVQEIVYTCV